MTDVKDPDMQMAMMAECMSMCRQDLIDMGIIDKSIAPMFVAEAVAHRLQAEQKQTEHWKANHADQVTRARILIERPDMPLERVAAYELVTRLHAQLGNGYEVPTVMKLYELLELVAVALGIAPEALGGFDFDTLVPLAQDAREEVLRFAACRHQARHMQEDGGEPAFIKGIDVYRRQNKLE